MSKVHGFCHICKKTNLQVRLYRPYGNFYRPKDNFCNAHVPEGSRDWYIPLCFDNDGSVWGYTSVPQDTVEVFYALPEADTTALGWKIKSDGPGISHWQHQ